MIKNDKGKIWEVGEFLDYLNFSLKKEIVHLVGEVGEVKFHPTGVYFILKDRNKNGILQCYIRPWKWKFDINTELREGLLFKVSGTPYVYKPKSTFSLEVEKIEPFGEGSLKKAYEILKAKLEKEGFFSRKRPLPEVISKIGLITSSQGAAIGDFLKNIKKIGLKIYFYDVRVEGENAVSDITKALDYFNSNLSREIDVLVIIRGGGSLEDLQAFNSETVVKKIFGSSIPVICGIGHERDISLASLASDVEVSTPSFAAQVINSSWENLYQEVEFLERKIINSFEKMFLDLPILERSVLYIFKNILEKEKINLNNLKRSLQEKLNDFLIEINNKIDDNKRYLKIVNPLRALKLGYSIVLDSRGKVVKEVSFLKKGDRIKTRFYKGSADSIIEKVNLR